MNAVDVLVSLFVYKMTKRVDDFLIFYRRFAKKKRKQRLLPRVAGQRCYHVELQN